MVNLAKRLEDGRPFRTEVLDMAPPQWTTVKSRNLTKNLDGIISMDGEFEMEM